MSKITLTLTFDPETNSVDLEFDKDKFKTYDFVLAVLYMARMEAENNQRIIHAMQLQKKMQEQAKVSQLVRNIRPNLHAH